MEGKETQSKNRAKRVYLVDYENVHGAGLDGIFLLEKTDEVIIFSSVPSFTLKTSSNHSNQLKAKISVEKVYTGRQNSLDFQLCSQLGYLIAKNLKREFIIVSMDTTFKVIVDYWKARSEHNITLAKSVMETLDVRIESSAITDDRLMIEVEAALVKAKIKNLTNITEISKVIRHTKSLVKLHNVIATNIDRTEGREIYKAVKGIHSSYWGTQ